MSADARTVTVKLLDKEYTISCPDGVEAELLASADYLNQKMQEIRRSGKIIGLERIAVMAALNMSHELIRSQDAQRQNIETNLRRLGQKIDQGLAHKEPKESHENSSTS
ncbi:cell division protein ZapA [Marinobacterium marinum]|uniref:Cell division protein ZapA n=1 Tax=Marinobacterium marinum TaxID=2756129 RepID=A0A7W1WWQ9_9GAMM|nr:cell division protein ZapA [Marinobacterium marinum]MBA4501619.1 cell division protein ZapA [Marinobacterium marinum]